MNFAFLTFYLFFVFKIGTYLVLDFSSWLEGFETQKVGKKMVLLTLIYPPNDR